MIDEIVHVHVDTYRREIFFFQAEDGIRYLTVTGVQTCALPISPADALAVGVAQRPRDAGAGGGDGRKPRLLHEPGTRHVPGVGEHQHARSGVQLPERVRLLSWTGLHDSSWLMAGGGCADLVHGNLPRVVNTCEVSHASCSRGPCPGRPARGTSLASLMA